MQVECAAVAVILFFPDLLIKSLPEEGDIFIFDKENEKSEFLVCQINRLPVLCHTARVQIHNHAAGGQLLLRLVVAAEHGLHPGHELDYVKRLDEIVVRAEL